MPQNPRTIVRATRGWLGIVAAGVIAVITILIPATAFAASTAGTLSSAHAAKASALPAASSGAVSGQTPDASCAYHWNWQANNYLQNGGYTQVEWTSNPCRYSIQERSWCNEGGGSGYWSTSGIVKGTNIWDKSSCTPLISYASRGEVRFNYGGGWTTYQTFWTG